MKMGRLLVLLALCVLPALVTATRPVRNPFLVCGKVYCDTCRAGFETTITTYLQGAKVRLECKDSAGVNLLYSVEGKTDATGTFEIRVADDHEDQICEAVLVSSPQGDCASADPGRDRARVILTNSNGIVSNIRFANNLGFFKDQPMSVCPKVLEQYHLNDEDY